MATTNGIYSRALRMPVFHQDNIKDTQMKNIDRGRRIDIHPATFSLSVEIPPVAGEPYRILNITVTVTRDPDFADCWIINHFYRTDRHGSIVDVNKDVAFMDCEQTGNAGNNYTTEPATLQIGVPGDDETRNDHFEVLIVQLCQIDTIGSTLVRFMQDHRISKCWHGFYEDMNMLDRIGIHPHSSFQINALVYVYLEIIGEEHTHVALPRFGDLMYEYLGVDTDTAQYARRYWADLMIHPWKARYGAHDVYLPWKLYQNLVLRIKGEIEEEEDAESVIRKAVARRMVELELGGSDAVLS
ncbi:hypothetical protein HK097_000902 [Rhizophlyctis rosea]|uniref:3'-5' exonuclease domain-containing protein n=1 Tax=Rhizophlyctis rosea TaxID=64517 RepID=A0AAD5S4Z3_9FUNG|nr:hypothetical protein HK097_000902 [Rhizophlyctis rosea]